MGNILPPHGDNPLAKHVEPAMTAPELDVLLDNGEKVSLRELYASGPIVLIFLRHLGCIFCRQQVKDLIDFDPMKVIFVSASPPDLVAKFKEELGSKQRYICDPDIELYKAFGLGRGGFGQMLNLHTVKEALSAFSQGTRTARPVSDPMLLGGAFILSREGEVTWSHKAGDAADNVSASDLNVHLAS